MLAVKSLSLLLKDHGGIIAKHESGRTHRDWVLRGEAPVSSITKKKQGRISFGVASPAAITASLPHSDLVVASASCD